MTRDLLDLLDILQDDRFINVSFKEAMLIMEFLMLHDGSFKCKTLSDDLYVIKLID